MEEKEMDSQQAADQIYNYAADMLVNQKMERHEVTKALMDQGLDEDSACIVVDNLENEIHKAKKESANKDILWGSIWCAGGIIFTVADIGYIFWGAIVFGGFQLIRGLAGS